MTAPARTAAVAPAAEVSPPAAAAPSPVAAPSALAESLARVPPPSPAPGAAGLASPAAAGTGPPTPADAPVPAGVLADEVSLVGGAVLTPPEPVARYLEAARAKGGPVRVRLGSLASGLLTVQYVDGGYRTPGSAHHPVALHHPLLARLRSAGVEPVLAVRVENGLITGHASVMVKKKLAPKPGDLLDAMAAHTAALGWAGLDMPKFRGVVNELRGPTLVLQATNVAFGIGRFLSASGSFGLANEQVTLDVTAKGAVPGLGTITVPIRLGPDGALTGSATVDLALKGFTGQLTASFAGGAVDVQGTVRYANEKFDGTVTIVATDKGSAQALTDSHTPAQAAAAAPAPAPRAAGTAAPAAVPASAVAEPVAEPASGPKPGPRVVVGWGTVKIRLADWLSGEALVVVDQQGEVTVVGKITPKLDKPLFPQRDYIKALPKLEVRALYGVPVVGNVYVFANVGLEVLAKLGPATLTGMEITGTWSTKPDVLQKFGLIGTLNVSAFAGLRLTAEGGAGIEIIDHDIKAGVAVSALAGIRGYVEATPKIGYREFADPKAGKRGEFFIGGHLEIAAQPFLGLGGELFVELDSPWWSPAPDKRWPWPIGQLEYPLPGEFGIGADVEHVLGSDRTPEIKFGEVDFSAEKFMTDLVSDHVPPKKAKDEEKKGTWKEGEAAKPGAADPVVAGAAPPAPADKAAKGKHDPAEGDVPKPELQGRWLAGLKAIGALAETSHKNPQDATELSRALAKIKNEHGFTSLDAELSGTRWLVSAHMNPDTPKPIAVDADPGAGLSIRTVAKRYGDLYRKLKENHIPGGRINQTVLTAADREVLEDEFPDRPLDELTLAEVRDHAGVVGESAVREADLKAVAIASRQAREHEAGKTIYDRLGDIPAKNERIVFGRAAGKDEYSQKPLDPNNRSIDHTFARREFADLPGLDQLGEGEPAEIVHDPHYNLRMQDRVLNSRRRDTPWTEDFPGRSSYSVEALTRAEGLYERAKAWATSEVKKRLASRRR